MYRSSWIGITSLMLMACAGNSGTQPHDASSAGHEAMAQEEDRAAEAHNAESKSSSNEAPENVTCGRFGCWSSSKNPSEQHQAEAQRHKEMAAKHRAASAALASAEQSACQGISEDDRDISPFYHRDDITSVSVLEEPVQSSKPTGGKKTIGARVVFRANPGMTAEWLQRVVDCHLARAAAAGHSMPEMDYCPLVPNGVKAKVTSTGNGFAVDMTSDDSATAAEIIRRAQALKS